jgi:hypothetical protein
MDSLSHYSGDIIPNLQNNFFALVIILFVNSYSYDMEEGATHGKI